MFASQSIVTLSCPELTPPLRSHALRPSGSVARGYPAPLLHERNRHAVEPFIRQLRTEVLRPSG